MRRKRRTRAGKPERSPRRENTDMKRKKDTRTRRTKKVKEPEIAARKGSVKQRTSRRATWPKNMGNRWVPRILRTVLSTAILKGTSQARPQKLSTTLVSLCSFLPTDGKAVFLWDCLLLHEQNWCYLTSICKRKHYPDSIASPKAQRSRDVFTHQGTA